MTSAMSGGGGAMKVRGVPVTGWKSKRGGRSTSPPLSPGSIFYCVVVNPLPVLSDGPTLFVARTYLT